jgi:hypothetical protein
MAIKFEKVEPGMVLYDWHRTKMGNTNISRMGCWEVRIIDKTERGCTVSWNSNRPQFYGRRRVERLHRKRYEKKTPGPFGR